MTRLVILAAVPLWVLGGSAALAQTGSDYTRPPVIVQSNVEQRTATPAPVVVGGTLEERGSAGLPITGGDIAGLATIGAGAIAAGAVLVRRGRPRRRPAAD